MLMLENVYKSYGDFHAVRGVSFSIKRGEIVGLLGPNGAGKTTIMRILTCYHFPSSGKVEIDNLEIFNHPEEIKQKTGYLPENAPVYSELSVAEYLEFQAAARIGNRREQKAGITKAVKNCGLEDVYNRPIGELSKGYRQRVGLAQAIIHDPEILILDEPTSGLDPNQIQEIRHLIRNLGKEKTIIISTHIMQEVEAVCDRVLILNKGVIAAEGDTKSIGRELRGSDDCYYVRFNSISPEQIAELETVKGVNHIIPKEPGFEVFINSEQSNKDVLIFDWTVKKKLKLRELVVKRLSLEDVFSTLTREGNDLTDNTKSEEVNE